MPVILISVDTLRADHLGCYGYQRMATPHIDGMTAGATLFLQASSQVPLTLPSHVSLLTSTYPFVNGIEDNGERLGPNAVTLARVLKSHGYRTAAFVGGFVLDRRFGLDQGFDVYDGPASAQARPGEDPGDLKRPAEAVTRAAREWLERNSEGPFFLFVHLYDLHTPYDLPAAQRRPGPAYDAELAYVDATLGKFWDFLERRGLLRRAVVAFTADHGESLHEHGESTHGYFVYQSTLRVPLMLHWPDGQGPFEARVAEPVSLLDVAPTLLDAAGLPRPAEFQGRSLVQRSAPEWIYSESLYPHAHFGASSLRALRAGRYKYIQAPHPELYDLEQDPAEQHNLYPSQAALALRFRGRLESLRARFRREAAGPRQAPDAIAKLQSLGYLAGGSAGTSASDAGPDPKDRIGPYEEYGRAIRLAAAGQIAASNALLERLLRQDPSLVEVRASLALNLQKLGRHAEAARDLRTVLQRDPLNAVAHFNLAISENSLGHPDQAIRELQATLALAPYYVRAEEMLASLYLRARQFEPAREHLQHLLEMDSRNYTANYNLGALETLQGDWDRAEQHLRVAIQADPHSAEAHNTLGSLQLRRGNLEAARTEFLEAIRMDSQFAWAHYNLGMLCRRQQKRQEAALEFRKALAADPRFTPAREALERLDQAGGEDQAR